VVRACGDRSRCVCACGRSGHRLEDSSRVRARVRARVRVCMYWRSNAAPSKAHYICKWDTLKLNGISISLRGFLSQRIRQDLSQIINEQVRTFCINSEYKFILKMKIFTEISTYVIVWNEQRHCHFAIRKRNIIRYSFIFIAKWD